jgi:hypothetical protein
VGDPSRELRRELADRVLAELAADLPRVSAHFGEEYADSTAPDARALRERGGTFEWVAFAFDPHPMWDTHVGVLTADGEVSVGFHVHERLARDPPDAVETLAGSVGAEYRYSDTAAEHQFNRPPVPSSAADVGTLAAEVSMLCRRFEPVVDDLEG